MRIFVDECVDWRLARDIAGHEVKTARQLGWITIKNGELLALAADKFDVFVTVDRNLSCDECLPGDARLNSRSTSDSDELELGSRGRPGKTLPDI